MNHPTRGLIKALFSNDFRILREKVRDVNKNKEGLTGKDGSAFEKQYADATKKDSPNRHNYKHNYVNLGCPLWIKKPKL